MNGVARKAQVYAISGTTAWVGIYAWPWLAGLVAIVAGTALIFISPNDPPPAWMPPQHPNP